ncbi:MAG TPA: helix-turn-helix domain-containing protein [Streptosporangiaceae bacterium]
MDRHVEGTAPTRHRLRGPERRETILRAAAEVFVQAGYRAGKVSDVAARVGVTEPVIFQNFGSKAALFAAVLERAAADVQASLDDLAAGFGSASGLLAHVLTGPAHGRPGQAPTDPAAQDAGAGHPGAGYGALFADAAALAAEPELSEPARTAVRAITAHLAGLIQRAQADGDLRPDADPEAAAWLLLSVLSARRLRAAAMPPGLEPAVIALAQQALAPPAAAARSPGSSAAQPGRRRSS